MEPSDMARGAVKETKTTVCHMYDSIDKSKVHGVMLS